MVKRRISRQAGRPLEALGHAIDYLIDEGQAGGLRPDKENGRSEAVRLLMARNRQIYFDCPEVRTLAERWHSLLHFRRA
jgi:hypothetical protein